MKNPLKPLSVISLKCGRLFAVATLSFFISLFHGQLAQAQNPDLTNGEVRFDNDSWNLGPTGMSGWFYRTNWTAKYDGWDTDLARQIEVMTVDAGSPAAGILQVGDVILGADGTGADPVAFTSDARKSFADAIGDAEANTPATLKLLVWRAGTTSIMSLTLEAGRAAGVHHQLLARGIQCGYLSAWPERQGGGIQAGTRCRSPCESYGWGHSNLSGPRPAHIQQQPVAKLDGS